MWNFNSEIKHSLIDRYILFSTFYAWFSSATAFDCNHSIGADNDYCILCEWITSNQTETYESMMSPLATQDKLARAHVTTGTKCKGKWREK